MSYGAFLYFFPSVDRDKLTLAAVQATWLADVWTDELRSDAKFVSVTRHFTQVGPSGSSGVIACVANPRLHSDQRIGFYPEHQTWTQFGDVWLGFDNADRPTPESLQRDKLIPGYEVELGDGNIWIAPIIRQFNEGDWSCGLPMKVSGDTLGGYSETVRNDVAWAWEMACELWDMNSSRMTRGRFLECVVRLLGLNYRVGLNESKVLELFDHQNMQALVSSYLDVPSVREWEESQDVKKNQATAAV